MTYVIAGGMPVIPPNPLVCPECGFVARRECGLGSHRYWKHGVPGKTYPPPRFGIVIDCVEVANV